MSTFSRVSSARHCSDALFFLTLALSPGERETRFPHWLASGRFIFFVFFVFFVCFCERFLCAAPGPAALVRDGFAHNDYEHKRPLVDALELGFCAVEADIYLVDGRILVGHDADKLSSERTLSSLYLEPLAKRVRENGGKVFRDGPEFLLLIDVKSDTEPTYAALKPLLAKYAPMLTKFTANEIRTNAVTIILSGNRPIETVSREAAEGRAATRLAAIDGRMTDLGLNPPVALVPLVSDNSTKLFQWNGTGTMSVAENARLKMLVGRAPQ